jgi:hypothetical protein
MTWRIAFQFGNSLLFALVGSVFSALQFFSNGLLCAVLDFLSPGGSINYSELIELE